MLQYENNVTGAKKKERYERNKYIQEKLEKPQMVWLCRTWNDLFTPSVFRMGRFAVGSYVGPYRYAHLLICAKVCWSSLRSGHWRLAL